jgi:hypothetical protein
MNSRFELAQKIHLHKDLSVLEIVSLLRQHDIEMWELACKNQKLVLSYLIKNEKETILNSQSPEPM